MKQGNTLWIDYSLPCDRGVLSAMLLRSLDWFEKAALSGLKDAVK